MPPYMLICLCIWILTLTTAMEIPAAATGIGVSRFYFGALAVVLLARVQIQNSFLYCNAAALFWPVYWLLVSYRANAGERGLTPDALAVCLPVLYALAMLFVNGALYMYFTFELDVDALNMEMLLWAAALALRSGAYIYQRRSAQRLL